MFQGDSIVVGGCRLQFVLCFFVVVGCCSCVRLFCRFQVDLSCSSGFVFPRKNFLGCLGLFQVCLILFDFDPGGFGCSCCLRLFPISLGCFFLFFGCFQGVPCCFCFRLFCVVLMLF